MILIVIVVITKWSCIKLPAYFWAANKPLNLFTITYTTKSIIIIIIFIIIYFTLMSFYLAFF